MKRRSLLKSTANGALVLLLGSHQIAKGAGIVAVLLSKERRFIAVWIAIADLQAFAL